MEQEVLNNVEILHWQDNRIGTKKPFAKASAQTHASVAEPSQPVRIYVKSILKLHMKRQFCEKSLSNSNKDSGEQQQVRRSIYGYHQWL